MTRLLAAAALFGLILTAPASAQSADTAPFLEACIAIGHEGFGLADADQSVLFCGCLTGSLSSRPQVDLDILTADLKGESTEASRAAHGSYEALEEAARDAVEACVAEVTEATAPAAPAAPAAPSVPSDMTAFDANCRASTRLRDYLADAPRGADAAVESACGCVSAEFSTRFSQPVVDFLGSQLAAADPGPGVASATAEQEAAGPAAEEVMGQCLSAAMAS